MMGKRTVTGHVCCGISKNHSMFEIGKDLWRSSCPTALLKQHHLEPVAQGYVQMAFKYLYGSRLYNQSVQAVPMISHPMRVKKIFLIFRWHFLCFSLCPLPLFLSLGTTEKCLGLSSLHPPCRYLCTLMRSPPDPSFLQAEQSQVSQSFVTGEMLQFLKQLCSLLLDSPVWS